MNKTAQAIVDLGASSSDGVILVIKTRTSVILQSGDRSVEINISDGTTNAEYQEAMEQLTSNGYIKANNTEKTSYQITTKAYKASNKGE
jgi:hypothetical protein